MGLISGLLFFPVSGPAHGLQFVLEQIRDQVESEQLDEERIRAELVNLNLLLDLGEISAEEHTELEDALIERLNMIRAYNEGLLDPVVTGEAELEERRADGAES